MKKKLTKKERQAMLARLAQVLPPPLPPRDPGIRRDGLTKKMTSPIPVTLNIGGVVWSLRVYPGWRHEEKVAYAGGDREIKLSSDFLRREEEFGTLWGAIGDAIIFSRDMLAACK